MRGVGYHRSLRKLRCVGDIMGSSEKPSPPATSSSGTIYLDAEKSTVDQTLCVAGAQALPPQEIPGMALGPYTLIERIGAGGFGAVWLAEQRAPVKRSVALKILKPGVDTQEVIRRFEAERQALAMMDHPNIAHVFDAGATAAGRPYFVMELVRGISIIKYCASQKLDARARLELFVQVCHAIGHAHQKGVIHRDIKPSNVLVTQHDGTAQAKVIDFGIAKAISDEPGDSDLTRQGQLIGTPEYMSPEQAQLGGDIDTRTDVYSLGVLLYELLTGQTPISHADLIGHDLGEMARRVREVEPQLPSTRVSTLGRETGHLEPFPHEDAHKLRSVLRGDLDWITMKCLEKDRARRYETVNALAMDVVRHLNGEAVLAAPPSRSYRITKFARRHKGAVAAAGIVFAALLAGLASTLWQAQRASNEAARAQAAEAQMRQRAEELEQVARFQESQLSGIDTVEMGAHLRQSLLDAVPPEERVALEAELEPVNFTDIALGTLDASIFDQAMTSIEEQFSAQPLVKARLFQSIANAMRELGLLESAMAPQQKALEIRRRALGEAHPDTLTSINETGLLLQNSGKLTDAEPYLRQALEGRRRVLGNQHADTLTTINDIGELLFSQGQRGEAGDWFREALEGRRNVLDADHPDILLSLNNLGASLTATEHLAEAEPIYREVLNIRRRTLGENAPGTLESVGNLAALLRRLGKFNEAAPLYEEALAQRRHVLGNAHPNTIHSMNGMVRMLGDLGHYEESLQLAQEALDTARRTLGNNHPVTFTALDGMGVALLKLERPDEAKPYLQEALESRRRVLGEQHPSTMGSLYSMAMLMQEQGNFAEAERIHRIVLDASRRSSGEANMDTLVSASNTGVALRELGRLEEAAELGKESVETAKRALPRDHWLRGLFASEYAQTLAVQHRFSEAETLALEADAIYRRSLEETHVRRIENIRHIVALYEAWNTAEPGHGYDTKAAQWRGKLAAARDMP